VKQIDYFAKATYVAYDLPSYSQSVVVASSATECYSKLQIKSNQIIFLKNQTLDQTAIVQC